MPRTCSGVTVEERGRSSWVIEEDWADVNGSAFSPSPWLVN